MKVVLVNGSPNEKGCTYTALHEVEKQLHKHDGEAEEKRFSQSAP